MLDVVFGVLLYLAWHTDLTKWLLRLVVLNLWRVLRARGGWAQGAGMC